MRLDPGREAHEHDPFGQGELAARYRLTAAQNEILLSAVMEPRGNLGYNEGLSLALRGPLRIDALRTALAALIQRHDALRGSISPNGRWLCVCAEIALPWRCQDLSAGTDPSTALQAVEAEEMSTPFDLEKGPLLRLRLLRLAPEHHQLLLVAHHIVCDGWSTAVLLRELAALYSAAVDGGSAQLAPAPSFGAYAARDGALVHSQQGRRHERYWLQRLEQAPPPVAVPPDRPYPAARSFAAARIDQRLSSGLTEALRQLGARHGASLVATLLAGFSCLLHRVSGSEDMVIGLAAAGQPLAGQPDLVGHCANLLPLRLQPRSERRFAEFLHDVSATLLAALEQPSATFGSLLPQLRLVRDQRRPPLISAVLNMEVREPLSLAGLDVDYRNLAREADSFELFLNVVGDGGELLLECTYNSDIFEAASLRLLLEELATLLRGACDADAAHPETPTVGSLPLLRAQDKARMLGEWNDTRRDYPLQRALHEFIREQCARTPAATALRGQQGELSYAELERRSNQLARWLRERGVGAGSVVGVCTQRSWEMVLALLATLKAGAAYLPLDPSYPAGRLDFMLRDAECGVVLTQLLGDAEMTAAARERVLGGVALVLDLARDWAQVAAQSNAPPDIPVPPDALAYVLYTSGSTGKPKGVMIEHRAIVNRLLWMQQQYGLTTADRVLQKTPFSFDVSVWEFFWPLMQGAMLVMAPPQSHRDAAAIAELVRTEAISVCHFVPSMLAAFLEQDRIGDCRSLRQVFASGEVLPYELTQRFFARLPQVELHNLYGPTEAAVDCSYWACRVQDERRIVPIGRPVANTRLYVLEGSGALAPPGVIGELHIGGVQLARGYLKRIELTAERFIDHPELGRLYRTGDACRWLHDGSIEYRGRLDSQVKLRGLRIELGEIEATALQHPAVREAAAALRECAESDARLVLYYGVRQGQEASKSELREVLRHALPEHMVPQHFVELEQLPTLSNGKVNRAALPDPFVRRHIESPANTPPRTPAEAFIASLWGQLLGVQSIGVEDRFFDLGGHSLLAVRAAAVLRRQYAVKLPLRTILMEPVSQVAAVCARGAGVPDGEETAGAAAGRGERSASRGLFRRLAGLTGWLSPGRE